VTLRANICIGRRLPLSRYRIHIFKADDQVAAWLEPAVAIFALRDRLNVLPVPTVGYDHGIGSRERVVFQRRQGLLSRRRI
jgi:hypothetical protein